MVKCTIEECLKVVIYYHIKTSMKHAKKAATTSDTSETPATAGTAAKETSPPPE